MKKLLLQIIIATLGLWIATLVVPGVKVQVLSSSSLFGLRLTQPWQIFSMVGVTLGLLNFFVRPILNLVTLPLRLLTLGLSSFIVEMALIWVVALLFREVAIALILPLFFTTLIIWILNLVLGQLAVDHEDHG